MTKTVEREIEAPPVTDDGGPTGSARERSSDRCRRGRSPWRGPPGPPDHTEWEGERDGATFAHQKIVGNLIRLIGAWIDVHPGGEAVMAPLDVILAEDTVVQPDLVYISHERLATITASWIHGAPDLVVEVGSPSTRARGLTTRRRIYARFGVSGYWLADPATRVLSILVLSGRRYRQLASGSCEASLDSQVLPGRSVVPAAVFRGA